MMNIYTTVYYIRTTDDLHSHHTSALIKEADIKYHVYKLSLHIMDFKHMTFQPVD